MDEQITEALDAAIRDVIGKDGSLVNKWVVVVDTLRPEGRACAYLASDDMMSWEVIGMAEAASEYARLQLVEAEIESLLDEEDEDERD
jgi:hypothetical protein